MTFHFADVLFCTCKMIIFQCDFSRLPSDSLSYCVVTAVSFLSSRLVSFNVSTLMWKRLIFALLCWMLWTRMSIFTRWSTYRTGNQSYRRWTQRICRQQFTLNIRIMKNKTSITSRKRLLSNRDDSLAPCAHQQLLIMPCIYTHTQS